VKRLTIAAAVLAAAAGSWWYWRSGGGIQDLPPGALRSYNVLLVTIDTLRADRVGAYGQRSGLTPALDALAKEGLRFESVHAQAPLTLPSHASLMTGRVPPRHGVRDNGTYRLDAAQPTLAAAMKAAGYQTGAFVGAFVLDGRFGLARGFETYDDQYAGRPASGPAEVVERPADEVTARAGAWIRAATGQWFAWLHLYDPHEPYAPPEPFRTTHASAPYDGEVAYADAALGRLLADLRSAGRLDRTLIVVTADHGEGLGEHGERTHGLFAYDSTLRVPLIVWCGTRLRPQVVSEPAGLVDLAPTIADLVGASWSGGDGRSLRGRLNRGEAGDHEPAPVYFEALNASLTRNWAPLTGIVADGLKLIDLPVPELYDLGADPREQRNLYDDRPADVQRLQRLLDGIAAGGAAPAGGTLDAETAARLKSLGYVASQPAARKRQFTVDDDPKNLVSLDTALDEAMKMSGRGDHAAAADMLRDVIRKRPDLPLAYDRLAFVLRAGGRLADAIAVLEDAASKALADAPALMTLGTMFQEVGKLDRAVTVLEAAVKLNDQDLEARSRLGAAYAQAGRVADAERTLRGVLDADPDSPEALTNLGVLYLQTGRGPDAVAALRRAIDANPSAVGARNTLAVVYARSGDLPGAVEEWRQVIAIRPDDPDVLYNLGTALLRLNRAAEARPFLERFVKVAPPRYDEDRARLQRLIPTLPSQR
jgi:arylsulfatase A-like enzyme